MCRKNANSNAFCTQLVLSLSIPTLSTRNTHTLCCKAVYVLCVKLNKNLQDVIVHIMRVLLFSDEIHFIDWEHARSCVALLDLAMISEDFSGNQV